MLGYEFLWGDALPGISQHIIGHAAQKGTREAFHDAAEQLSGIQSFIIYMNLGKEFTCDATLRLSSEILRMRRMEDDPTLRKAVTAAMRQAGA